MEILDGPAGRSGAPITFTLLGANDAALDDNHSVVYSQTKALGLYLPHPEVQLPVATVLAGAATWQACSHDVLRYISHVGQRP